MHGPATDTSGGKSRGNGATKKDDHETKVEAAKLNPLAPFMAQWMSPKDYALLKPGMTDSLTSSTTAWAEVTLPGALTAATMDINRKGNALTTLPGRNLSPVGVFSPAADNPFIQFVVSPALPAKVTAPAPPVVPASAATAPVEPPPEKPKAPAIAKPSDDAKYFKQLKRF